MSSIQPPPPSTFVFPLAGGDSLTISIGPAGLAGALSEPDFVRTRLREAPSLVNIARALMAHAAAVLDELEGLSEAEFVAVCEAYTGLSRKSVQLSARVAWNRPAGEALREPGT